MCKFFLKPGGGGEIKIDTARWSKGKPVAQLKRAAMALGWQERRVLDRPQPSVSPTSTKSSEKLAAPSPHQWWQISPKRQASRARQTRPPHLASLPVPITLKLCVSDDPSSSFSRKEHQRPFHSHPTSADYKPPFGSWIFLLSTLNKNCERNPLKLGGSLTRNASVDFSEMACTAMGVFHA